jgi:ATP-dependent Clp protease ATP-binding subunit ClpA
MTQRQTLASQRADVTAKLAQQPNDAALTQQLAQNAADSAQLEATIAQTKAQRPMMAHDKVDDQIIAQVVGERKNMPELTALESDIDQARHLPERLGARVVHQEQSIQAITDAVVNRRTGVSDDLPTVIALCGPPGTGKTTLAESLADLLNHDKPVTVNMSGFSEGFTATGLTGAPPAYVGFDAKVPFEPVRQRPNAVVLMDEAGREADAVRNSMLEMESSGWFSPKNGDPIDMRNTIIIYCTNKTKEQLQASTDAAWFDRLDAAIDVNTLRPQDYQQIAHINLQPTVDRLLEGKTHLNLNVDPAAEEAVGRQTLATASAAPATEGGTPRPPTGRSIKREIRSMVQTPLGKLIASGQVHPGDSVHVGATGAGNQLSFQVVHATPAAAPAMPAGAAAPGNGYA